MPLYLSASHDTFSASESGRRLELEAADLSGLPILDHTALIRRPDRFICNHTVPHLDNGEGRLHGLD